MWCLLLVHSSFYLALTLEKLSDMTSGRAGLACLRKRKKSPSFG
jgi:hypothetical protein